MEPWNEGQLEAFQGESTAAFRICTHLLEVTELLDGEALVRWRQHGENCLVILECRGKARLLQKRAHTQCEWQATVSWSNCGADTVHLIVAPCKVPS